MTDEAAGLLQPGYVIENLFDEVLATLSGMAALDQSLGAILDAAMRLLAAREAYVFLRVGDQLRLRASRGLYQSLAVTASLALGEGIEGLVAERGEGMAIADVTNDPRFRDLPGRASAVRSMLAIPMKLRGEVVGVLVAAKREVGSFSIGQQRWLAVLGQMAAVAIENDRLLDRERRRSRQAEVLLGLTSLEPASIDDFLQRLAEAVNDAMSVNMTGVLLVDPIDGLLVSRGLAGRAMVDAARRGGLDRIAIEGDDLICHVFNDRQSTLCNETYDEPRARRQLTELGIRSILASPIVVDGQTVGVIYLATARPGSFESDDPTFLTLIAERVGLQVRKLELAERRTDMERQHAHQRAREDFTAIVSHELKTPVAVIRAYTEVLQRRAEKGEPDRVAVDILSRIEDQAVGMLAMIDQLLDLQRIEGGVLLLERSRFDLADLAGRVAEGLQVTTSRHTLTVVAPHPVMVIADRQRIEEVLHNLVGNAVKYSPHGGPVTITVSLAETEDVAMPLAAGKSAGGVGAEVASEQSRCAVVEVADRGIGIATRDQSRVFERFYQAVGAPYKGRVGLGLGLYISKEIISRHGGHVWMQSQAGAGSRFYFSLPLAESADSD